MIPAPGDRVSARAVRALFVGLLLSLSGGPAFGLLPSPYDILRSDALETPYLDAVPVCLPEDLDPTLDAVMERARAGDWRAARKSLAEWIDETGREGPQLEGIDLIFRAREAEDRGARRKPVREMKAAVRSAKIPADAFCLRLELARNLMMMKRVPEASAQLTLAERLLDEITEPGERKDQIAFGRAEILYRTGKAFEAHLAYRELARSSSPRLAAGARLRLTDLSFDAGQVDRVSLEYEALLPRATAFGATMQGWALRAAEAAFEAGHNDRGLGWIERFLEGSPSRDARDAAEIRLADVDVALEDPLGARKRLSAVSNRHRGDAVGSLAAVRAIDLGVHAGSAQQRLDVLLKSIREQKRGVRNYSLGVLMRELEHREDLNGALAVATRLSYEGIDTVVTPSFEEDLGRLLENTTGGTSGQVDCHEVVRALGGRYGILIDRASKAQPFVRLGECFEKIELPWLATSVYRTVARRFGIPGAQLVALPLARSSLAIGEIPMARRAAQAALEEPDQDEASWRAVLAEADYREGRIAASVAGLRRILDEPSLSRERGKLASMLALSIEETGSVSDALTLADRLGGWLSDEAPRRGMRAQLVEAAMLAAHALRRAERIGRAIELYRLVDQHSELGAFRSSARFWLDTLDPPALGSDMASSRELEERLGSPWARVALFEQRYADLHRAYIQER